MAVLVEPVWEPAPIASAPPWSGTITRVEARAGNPVSSGDVVARVDEVDRLAFATADPFWRPLGKGDTGTDVSMLQALLTEQGFYDNTVDGVFGSRMEASIKLFESTLGVVEPTGVFDPGWLIWLPENPLTPVTIDLPRVTPAPAAGTPILIGPTRLATATLLDQAGGVVDIEGSWRLDIDDVTVDLSDGRIDESALETLSGVLDQEDVQIPGTITRAQPVTILEIPVTAVVSNASGEMCVFVPEGDGYLPRTVELADGQVSWVQVVAGLTTADRILVNPSDILSSPSCS